jgi:predicted ribosomally synthesized peptide with SipW-like signal peptide
VADHARSRLPRRSVLVRAGLALGVLGLVSVSGTFAFWTDSVAIGGTSVTAGTIDLKVNNGDSHTTTTLTMAAMVPGNTSAEVVTVKNGGTAPLRYNATGGLTGTDAAAYGTAGSLKLTLVKDGTRSGTGTSATCTGGTTLTNAAVLTSTTSTEVLALRGPLAAAGTESLCVQVTMAADAPSSLQGKTASLALTMTGTSDVG